MLSRILRTTLAKPVARYAFATAHKGGNLYTWGAKSAGAGFPISTGSEELGNPQRVEDFNNNVAKVSMGPNHTAVVTTDGELYTFGDGQYGALGHGDGAKSRYSPKLVEFFNENGLRVKDVTCGQHHTIALTEDGQLFSWGWGGKSINPFVNWFAPSFGALGLGNNAHRDSPTLIEEVPSQVGEGNLISGYNFGAYVSADKELVNWGVGKRGVFADESHKHLKSPIVNETLSHMKEDGKVIQKIRACGNSIIALFEDGSVYGWGENKLGQLGIKKDVGVELYEHIFHPEPIDRKHLGSRKIVDFDIGEELSVFLTSTNEVFWSGLKLSLAPMKLDLPRDIKVKRVAVANPYIVIVSENNEVYTTDRVIEDSEENYNTGLFKLAPSHFNDGEVVEIGGQYGNRYAIVRS